MARASVARAPVARAFRPVNHPRDAAAIVVRASSTASKMNRYPKSARSLFAEST